MKSVKRYISSQLNIMPILYMFFVVIAIIFKY